MKPVEGGSEGAAAGGTARLSAAGWCAAAGDVAPPLDAMLRALRSQAESGLGSGLGLGLGLGSGLGLGLGLDALLRALRSQAEAGGTTPPLPPA